MGQRAFPESGCTSDSFTFSEVNFWVRELADSQLTDTPFSRHTGMLCLPREFPVSVTPAVQRQTKHHGRHLAAYKAQHGHLCNWLEGWYLRLDDTGIPEMALGEYIWLCLQQKEDAINAVYS